MAEPLRVNLPAAPAEVRMAAGDDAPASGDGDADKAAQAADHEAARRRLEAERADLARARAALARAADRLADLQQQILAEAETHLLDLAVDIARKVIVQEIEADRCDIEPIVREALSHAPPRREAVVHLHPDDLAALEAAGTDEAPDLPHVHLAADPSVGRGECIVETAEGTVEARVEERLEQVRRAAGNGP